MPVQQLSSGYDSLNTHTDPNIYAYIRKTEVMDNNNKKQSKMCHIN